MFHEGAGLYEHASQALGILALYLADVIVVCGYLKHGQKEQKALKSPSHAMQLSHVEAPKTKRAHE